MTMTTSDRLERLDTMIAEGRLVRLIWVETTDKGRETACLLAALSPEAGARGSAAACPAEVMPQWMANLTLWMDDAGSPEAWSAMVRRYAAVARRWHVLTDEDWRRLDYTARRIAVEVAVLHIPDGKKVRERAACAQIVALCRRAEAGDSTTVMEWAKAEAAARRARGEEAWPATAPLWVARTAARLAEQAEDAAEAVAADMWAAREAATDRITALILGAIEAACDRRIAAVV